MYFNPLNKKFLELTNLLLGRQCCGRDEAFDLFLTGNNHMTTNIDEERWFCFDAEVRALDKLLAVHGKKYSQHNDRRKRGGNMHFSNSSK